MRGFIALVLLGCLALAGYNYWEIRQLRGDIARLEQRVDDRSTTSQLTDQLLARATVGLAEARDALAHADTAKARAAFDDARTKLADAYRTANAKAGPTVRWLQQQADELSRQIDARTK